jgi:Domain of unknown function DUF29
MATKSTVAAPHVRSKRSQVTETYERDFHAWLAAQVRAIREGRVNDIDAPNLAEELEDMARSAKKALKSQLVRLIAHLLKWSLQKDLRERNPSSGNRWLASIRNARDEFKDDLAESPSLKPYLPTIFDEAYKAAINSAVEDTGLADRAFPARCPWSLDDILGDDFLPD